MSMNDIFALGAFLVFGYACGSLCKRIKLPAVTGYLIAGLIMGVSFLNIVPQNIITELSFIEDIALGFIAFNIGESFNYNQVKRLGSKVIVITIVQAAVTIIAVTLGVFLATKNLPLAIVFGAIAAATAPAATITVMREFKAKGPLTNMTLTVVALDDAICLFLFSIAIALSKSMVEGTLSLTSAVLKPLIEIGFSLLVGAVIGMIFTYVGKKQKTSENFLVLSCAAVLFGAGVSHFLLISPILVCMTIGAAIANLCKRHDQVFKLTEAAVEPIYLIFFVMAGYSLDIKLVMSLGLLGIAFVISRALGKLIGAYLGCSIVKTDDVTKKYLGMGLMPMAGVGVGLAVAAAIAMPEYETLFLNIIMGSTFIFEILGPIFTAKGLRLAGEIKDNE